jgi:hypothetical protein
MDIKGVIINLLNDQDTFLEDKSLDKATDV